MFCTQSTLCYCVNNYNLSFKRCLTATVNHYSRNKASTDVHHVRSKPNSGDHDGVNPLAEPGHGVPTGSPTSSFRRARFGGFSQTRPKLINVFLEDQLLQAYFRRVIPKEVLQQILPDLESFGKRIPSEIDGLGEECERNPPKHVVFDAWGNRVDELNTCPAWKKQHDVAAEEGIIAIAYERHYGPWSRLYQLSKLYLYAPSSGLYSCPLAMTDGAAKFFQLHPNLPMKEKAFARLTTRNPTEFWTSGQWMTEKRGGSDVGLGTESLAVAQDDGTYKLYGYKWFSSATDSDMTLTLARIVDQEGRATPGSRGLSLFYLETKTPDGRLNNIEIHKLKDKLGTRQLPTAELLLDGTVAHLISDEGKGVVGITPMLTITRIHNAVAAVSSMRRIVHLARDYCLKRRAFGKIIVDHTLHMQTLSRLEVETRGAFFMTMEIARLLGLDDCGQASEREGDLLRLLTPVAKLYTGKQAVSVSSEALECFGGQGYIEDTGLPVFLRDAQVLSIWEGTTNILSLDVLRAVTKSKGQVLLSFFEDVESKLNLVAASGKEELQNSSLNIANALKALQQFVESSYQQHSSFMETAARDFAYSLARIYMATLSLEHAAWDGAGAADVLVAKRWCETNLTPVVKNAANGHYSNNTNLLDYTIVMEGHPDARTINHQTEEDIS